MQLTELETEFLYLYGMIPLEELQTSEIPIISGIDHHPTAFKIFQNIVAIITPVHPHHYCQQQLDQQLKNVEWLTEKAFHHHQYLTDLFHHFTILPMSFCTIYRNEKNLEKLLSDHYGLFLDKLAALKNKEEWNLKLFVRKEEAISHILNHNAAVLDLKTNLAAMTKGKQFLMKKKLEQLITSELEKEQAWWWQDILHRLKTVAAEVNLRKNLEKEITARKDDMFINCDFLINKKQVANFSNSIKEMSSFYASKGCLFQLTGPWPPYHFSSIAREPK